jgi:hypothetical protein
MMKTKLSPSVFMTVQVIACLFLLACAGVGASCQQPVVVMYEVTGSVPMADIQITSPSGGTESFVDMGLPWRFTYEGFTDGQAYVYAHNNSDDDGSVTVNIYVDGRLARTATSTGSYQTAVTYWDR